VGTLLQEQDNERQLPIVLTSGDFSLYEDCIPYFDSFTKKHFYLGNTFLRHMADYNIQHFSMIND